MNIKKWKQKARARDCSCVRGKDRNSNFNEVIDEIVTMYECIIETQKELRNEERNMYESRIRNMLEKGCCI